MSGVSGRLTKALEGAPAQSRENCHERRGCFISGDATSHCCCSQPGTDTDFSDVSLCDRDTRAAPRLHARRLPPLCGRNSQCPRHHRLPAAPEEQFDLGLPGSDGPSRPLTPVAQGAVEKLSPACAGMRSKPLVHRRISPRLGCGQAGRPHRSDVDHLPSRGPPLHCLSDRVRSFLLPVHAQIACRQGCPPETRRHGSLTSLWTIRRPPPRGALFQQLTSKFHRPVVS